jgi:RNA polymerase sigma-70 factor (ECF subfamily)
VHQSADLTQGFICDVMLHRGLLMEADPRRGRFRSLLLAALQNYLRERHRNENRVRPFGDDAGAPARTPESRESHPSRAFSQQWTATLIQRVLETVHRQCAEGQLGPHWTIFEHRVVRPMLLGEPPAAYPALMARLNVRSAAQASNMLITVKRRFARALLQEIARTVESRADVEDELRELLREMEAMR